METKERSAGDAERDAALLAEIIVKALEGRNRPDEYLRGYAQGLIDLLSIRKEGLLKAIAGRLEAAPLGTSPNGYVVAGFLRELSFGDVTGLDGPLPAGNK